MIPHNKPTLRSKELKAVASVLQSGWVAEGEEVRAFEDELSVYLGFESGHMVGVSSGSAALYMVLNAMHIGNGDEVLLPTYTCSALLNAIYLARATPVLVDIDPHDFTISFEDAIKKLSKKTKAIIVVHTFGIPAEVRKFLTLGIPVIEDCAQAVGTKLGGRHVGIFGNASFFSFYASKMMTTGYGGAVCFSDKHLVNAAKDYRAFDQRKSYYPRFNFHMSDIQGALGRVQLDQIAGFLQRRKSIAQAYYNALPVGKAWPSPNSEGIKGTNFYRFLVRTQAPRMLQKYLLRKGINTIIPIEPYELLHRYLRKNPSLFPVSEKVARTTLSLPIYPSLSDQEVAKVTHALKTFFSTTHTPTP